jgi:spore cortex formation protein SpoVR/YcgB (stage V sporulation)
MIAWEFVAKSNPCENFLVAESDFHENTFFSVWKHLLP